MSVPCITAVCAFTFYSICKKLKHSTKRFNENALDFEDQNNSYLLRKKIILNAVLTTGESKF